MTAPLLNRNCSRPVSSNQHGVHPQLEKVVRRHLAKPFQRPYPHYAISDFKAVEKTVEQHTGPLIFDSFCGVGESTLRIAEQHPDALVIGIDKSVFRLGKHEQGYQLPEQDNYRLLRADTDDFWRLAVDAGWQLEKHFLLYPNPWPKSSHFKRRVHGSPLFSSLLKLGGKLEVRSNWALYIEEFTLALSIAGQTATQQPYLPDTTITPFERKYQGSGQSLWRCVSTLD